LTPAEPVDRGDLVKGYQIAKGEYVILSREDFESVKLESTHTIDIRKFVPRESIDRLYWNVPLSPAAGRQDGHRSLRRHPRGHALGRLVMSTRERIYALEVEEDAPAPDHAASADEMRAASDVDLIELPKSDPRREPRCSSILVR
jgi:DNA end-binding protein Ku